ncbi:MAG: hypothetical protein M3Q65_08860 [Chloroflexota bacterium]|nr:hypothetical protein [Chloroflexota bacterium]
MEGRFREGSFSGHNLTGEYRFGDVAAAAGARPEDPGLSAYTGALEAALDALVVDTPCEDHARAVERERQTVTRLVRGRAFRHALLLARERRCAVWEEDIEV